MSKELCYAVYQLNVGDQISLTQSCEKSGNQSHYEHHAIISGDVGDGSRVQVIHATGVTRSSVPPKSFSSSFVGAGPSCAGVAGLSHSLSGQVSTAYWDLRKYVAQQRLHMYRYYNCYPAQTTIQLARSKIGPFDFDIKWNNCEHFARWCKTGRGTSEQAASAP